MKTIIYAYLSGVLVMFIPCMINLIQSRKVYLSDIITAVVYSILSWTTFVFVFNEALWKFLKEKGLDPMLWEKSE